MQTQTTTTAVAIVAKYYPPTAERPSGKVGVTCPFGCIATTPTGRPKRSGEAATHIHGIGAVGSRPDLGDRAGHCVGATAGYRIVDVDGKVPEVLTIVQVTR